MNKSRFNELAQQGYNRIPVMRSVLADIDTPVSTYLKLAQGPYTYLLESVQGGEKWGRYSMIGLPCNTIFRASGNQITIEINGEIVESFESDQPLDAVEAFQNRYKVPNIEELPSFQGGLVGYFAYDSVRYVEKRLQHTTPEDDIGASDILFMVSDQVIVFDNLAGTMSLIVMADPSEKDAFEQAQRTLDELVAKLPGPTPVLPAMSLNSADEELLPESEFSRGFSQSDFEAAVDTIKDYVLAGDAMQVVISQRMSIEFREEPLNLYRALRCLNPSPYMYYLNLGDHHVVGSSPEILARLENDTVTVRPIAGTRRRGYTPEEDLALEQELLADPKELAEHLMLIDLGRNDAGRVSDVGTVKLTSQMEVERYSHVMHIVSNVEGKIKPNLSAIDVLKAVLPAGTLSGAPKVRAMEIIDELEPVKRGIYGGAVGYLSWNGNMDTAIAIRTAVIKDETLYVQAGAGVVADSIPKLEWKETMNKARAIMRAAGMVKQLDSSSPTANKPE